MLHKIMLTTIIVVEICCCFCLWKNYRKKETHSHCPPEYTLEVNKNGLFRWRCRLLVSSRHVSKKNAIKYAWEHYNERVFRAFNEVDRLIKE